MEALALCAMVERLQRHSHADLVTESDARLGILNGRMKDYFGLWVLPRRSDFNGAVLATAIRATFGRRGTAIPPGAPLGLAGELGLDEQKTRQWQAFQRKNTLEPTLLATVVAALREFLLSVSMASAADEGFDRQWCAGAGWGTA